MLSTEVLKLSKASVLCWLATADERGMPNVSPKEVWAVFDQEYIVIANIASPVSARNIEANPLVCVSFIDIFAQKGFKVSGSANNVIKSASEFPFWSAQLERMVGGKFPIGSIFVVKANAVNSIVAPSYLLYPNETTEDGQRDAALRTYGVKS